MIFDTLKEIIQYATSLDITNVKVNPADSKVTVSGYTKDQSVVMSSTFHNNIPQFSKLFGMPGLDRLGVILNIPEYKENADVTITQNATGDLENIVVNNEVGDFTNVYRLMSPAIANATVADAVPRVKFNWIVSIVPTMASVQRLKYQATALSDNVTATFYQKDKDIMLEIGDANSFMGTFVFFSGAAGKLTGRVPVSLKYLSSILSLTGDKELKFSEQGIIEITIDSGTADYQYYMVPMSK